MIEYIEKNQALKCFAKYSNEWCIINALPSVYLGDPTELPQERNVSVTVTKDNGELIADIDCDIICKDGYRVTVGGNPE